VFAQQTLERYADLAMRSCLFVREDDVIALHGEPLHRDLLVALAASAYRAGAAYVDVAFVEPRVRHARLVGSAERHLGFQPGWADRRMRDLVAARGASVSINGPTEPSLMNDVDPRVNALERSTRVPGGAAYSRAVMANRLRFCVLSYPHPGWAAAVYPELSPAAATSRVAADVAWFCRIGPDDGDGTATWDAHVAGLARRAATLTALRLDRIEFHGAGTDLVVGLGRGARFVAADEETVHGDRFRANLPTEEVFTGPDPKRAEGTFRCTRPLTLDGRRITGIHGRLAAGKLVELTADVAADADYLRRYLSRDRGAGRLGELALVDGSSRIGQSGRTYGITLLDENAVSHIAFGSGYATTRVPGGDPVNASGIHVDVMIGGPEVAVTGVTSGGRRVPLIADGVWHGALV
jgi:aminopeptidase